MNEVEKMYVNAGIGQRCISKDGCHKDFVACLRCRAYSHPPFTAEKQIELIKFISNTDVFCNFHCYIVSARWSVDYGKWAVGIGGCDICHEQFEQALAKLVSNLWQDLTEEERKQIKEILE